MSALVAILLGAVVLAQARLEPGGADTVPAADGLTVGHSDHLFGPMPDVLPTVDLTPAGMTTIQSIRVADVSAADAGVASSINPTPVPSAASTADPTDR